MAEIRDELPKTFDACPCCGSQRRLSAVAQGFKPPDPSVKTALWVTQVPLTGQLLTSKVMMILSDICSDCGCLYATSLFEQEGHLEIREKQVPRGGAPRQE